MMHKSLAKGLARPMNTGLFGPIGTCASSSPVVTLTHRPDRRLRVVAHTEKDSVFVARADDTGCTAYASCGAM